MLRAGAIIQRFEHTSASAQKIDAPVHFPSTLNMAPFTSLASDEQGDSRHSCVAFAASPLWLSSNRALMTRMQFAETPYSYDLFAVVNHEGQMDTGHYTVFARSQDMVCQPTSLHCRGGASLLVLLVVQV